MKPQAPPTSQKPLAGKGSVKSNKSGLNNQSGVIKLHEKMKTLKSAIEKLTKDNNKLLSEAKDLKRAGIVLGLEEEMKRQDSIIELLREMSAESQDKLDVLIISKMDGNIKRVRPPTREELYMQLSGLNKTIDKLNAEYLKLNPAKDPQRFVQKGFQTEEGWLEHESSTHLTEIEMKANEKEKTAKKKLIDLERDMNQKQDLIVKLKDLIGSKGTNGQKLADLKEDLTDLKIDLEDRKKHLAQFDDKNKEVTERIRLLGVAKGETAQALEKQRNVLQSKLNEILKENQAMKDEIQKHLDEMSTVEGDSAMFAATKQIQEHKEALKKGDDRIQQVQDEKTKVGDDIKKLEKMVDSHKQLVENIKNEMQGKVKEAHGEREEQLLAEDDLDWEIEQLKERMKEERAKEIAQLETIEFLENSLAAKTAKSASLHLLANRSPDYLREEEMKEHFRQANEPSLNKKMLQNIALKQKVRELEDLIFVLKDEPLPASRAAKDGTSQPMQVHDDSVDSKIESIQTFSVLQPDEHSQLRGNDSKAKKPASTAVIGKSKIVKK